MTTQPDQDQPLQDELREWADIEKIASPSMLADCAYKAADRIDELERQFAEARKDQARLDTISNEYLQIEAFEIPTGSDDADIGWRIYQSYCGEENPRLIVEQYEDDLRQAIDAAIAQQKVKS